MHGSTSGVFFNIDLVFCMEGTRVAPELSAPAE